MNARILLIDNYDSFTFNLVQGFRILGAEVQVFRNDKITVDQALAEDVSHVVISPGPGDPDDAGVSMEVIRAFAGRVPVLGVCLGHQSLVAAFGGTIVRAGRIDAWQDLGGLPRRPGLVCRSAAALCGRTLSFSRRAPRGSAGQFYRHRTHADGEIMGVRDERLVLEGVQFHPESVLTPAGQTLLGNFLAMGMAGVAEVADERRA